jgi:hypothetical protein
VVVVGLVAAERSYGDAVLESHVADGERLEETGAGSHCVGLVEMGILKGKDGNILDMDTMLVAFGQAWGSYLCTW